jgi:hypothetical protein
MKTDMDIITWPAAIWPPKITYLSTEFGSMAITENTTQDEIDNFIFNAWEKTRGNK